MAVLLMGALVVPPAAAHFTENTRHLGNHVWKQVIRSKAYTRKQANARFYTKAQANALFAGVDHDHDERYYTQEEIDGLLDGGVAPWALEGNEGTDQNVNFVGTTDDEALNFRVNDARALRLEPDATSPNVIGGHAGNEVSAGAHGATIGGGGNDPNKVTNHFGTVGGGEDNQAGDSAGPGSPRSHQAVAGGEGNQAAGGHSAIGGGKDNFTGAWAGSVGGGEGNNAGNNWSTVGGGQSNAASGSHATVGGGQNNTSSGNWSFVGGGSTNTATNVLATVGGGSLNDATGQRSTVAGGRQNQASAQGATVGGGENNTAGGFRSTVGGGVQNTTSGDLATVGGGTDNAAGGFLATVGGGFNNTASGDSATVGGGQGNTASGSLATLPGGSRGAASRYGELAHASGSFTAVPGTAQASQFVLRNQTTDDTATELFLDGTGERLTLAAGQRLSFEVLVVGGTAAGETAGYRIAGLIKNIGGVTELVGTPTVDVLGEDGGVVWGGLVVDADDNALRIMVTGEDGTTIRWVATVKAAQLAF